ncbi:MAG TPA: SRPBCC family protein [Planctomycetaceae bacterium]|nr:SRPBCC family protein [Planctomycetaceae bacterium]
MTHGNSLPDAPRDPTGGTNGASAHGARRRAQDLAGLLRLWFGVADDVSRRAYALTGFGLMLFKYLAEAGATAVFAGTFLSPLDFLNPLLTERRSVLEPGPEWLPWAIVFWTLPFVWIAFSMSLRRAADAGMSPWIGLLVLVPVVNLVVMLLLAIMPAARGPHWTRSKEVTAGVHRLRSAVLGVAVGLGIALGMVGIGVYAFHTYGASLFYATPLVMGAVSAFIYNRPHAQSLGSSIGVAALSVSCAGLALLLFALEGAICILMLAPLGMGLAVIGGVAGKALADYTRNGRYLIPPLILLLPVLCGAESLYRPATEFQVTTEIVVDAPPETVWKHVVSFPDLPPPDEWYFRLGIACPERARITGSGVGAVRYCEFTTGTFVEPITAWDEPRRLAFDVTDQPPPMFELSPYRDLHPPHLHGVLVSTRGEFQLDPLPGGRTRLTGRTWYRFDMRPQGYWTLWSDLFIHRIHLRVLRHIARLAEGEGGRR